MQADPEMPAAPHARSAESVTQALQVDPARGLSAAEAEARLERFGANAIEERARRPLWRVVLDQFREFMILVLIAAAIVSGLIGEAKDAIAILVIIVLNAVIGVVQDVRAENAIAALKRLAAPHARVRRDGEVIDIETDKLVPGDVVLLEAGAVAPADLRLVESAGLQSGEAILTGESAPVDKDAAAIVAEDAPVGERRGMVFKGALITHGRGIGVAAATGADTEFGRIAALIENAEEARTPLQRRLEAFGARLAWAVLAICLVIFLAGLARGEGLTLMLMTAVSLAVAAIPEALPAVASIALAIGAYRMVRQNVLIRRLPAVETLGSVTFICTDKTGTLTENRMRAEAFWTPEGETPGPELSRNWRRFFEALALCNDAEAASDGAIGDPTETALLDAAAAHGVVKKDLEQVSPRLGELPFSSDRRRMSTLHHIGESYIAYSKGALEALAPRLADAHDLANIQSAAETMAAQGLRVMAVGMRRFAEAPQNCEEMEERLEFLGLVGLVDPPREGVKEAIAQCKRAQLNIVMITGDHPGTARAIALRLGLADENDDVMTGAELARLSDSELVQKVKRVRVYARVDPAQKIRIVEALQARGEYVAMTGDGVNDAPALKTAEIGVAMGRGGSDVARESAHMVLTDDNFTSIARAIREGRRVYDNIRKFIRYALTGNSGEIWTIFLAPFLGLPIPLLPIHILWVNLVTDGLPGLALASERAEPDIMRRPPRPPKESIFAHGMARHVLVVGFLLGVVCLSVQGWARAYSPEHAQTMVFTVLTLSQLGHCLAIRSEREPLWRLGLMSNRPLAWAVGFTFLLQLATIYTPFLHPVFHTTSLPPAELAICLAASSIVFFVVELEKWTTRRAQASTSSA